MRLATGSDRAEISAILAAVRQWMLGRGIRTWAPPFTEPWIQQKIADGEFSLGQRGQVAIATMRVQWSEWICAGWRSRGGRGSCHAL